MSQSSLNQDIFDAVLKEALKNVEKEEIKESAEMLKKLEESASDYTPSKSFIKRLRQDYIKYKAKGSVKNKTLHKTASVFLTVGLVSGAFAFVAEAYDIPLYETIFMREERYTAIETYKKVTEQDDEDSLKYIYFPKYLPTGFKITDIVSQTDYDYIYFEKEEKWFTISQWANSPNSEIRLDTENAVMTDIEVNGHKGFCAVKADFQTLYLNMGKISVNISGNIGEKKMMKIAKYLELVEK